MPMTARTPVPDEGELRLGSVRLPAGRPLRLEEDTDEPVAWITEEAVPEPGPLWSALTALHGQTGLVPILAPAGRGDDLEVSCYDPADVADVDRVDAAAIIEYLWPGSLHESWPTGPVPEEEREWADEMAAPFTSGYPGLAPATGPALPLDVLEAALREFSASRIALIPADRPADVLPVLGWCPGNWNSCFPVPSPVGFAAVLRSWEERFGARLFALTHDEACLLVERPPLDLDTALPVAAEHFVFCDEPAGRQSVRTTAAEIIGAPIWYFWWD
jgi:Domain of unknown function (DUF4253)